MTCAGCAGSQIDRLRPVAISNACDRNADPVKVTTGENRDLRAVAAHYAAGVKTANLRLIARRKCEAGLRARYAK